MFTLVAALERGYGLDARWSGPGTITIPDPACYTDGEPWQLSNASDSESGTFTLLSATTHSVNTVYAQVASAVTPGAIVDVAERMGIRSDLQPVCSITLGTQSVTPLDMTTSYATLAPGDPSRATPLLRSSTGGSHGSTPRGGVQANDATSRPTLEDVIMAAPGPTPASAALPPATGTTKEYWDAWFCGYTPQIAACVWVGLAGEIHDQHRGQPGVFGERSRPDLARLHGRGDGARFTSRSRLFITRRVPDAGASASPSRSRSPSPPGPRRVPEPIASPTPSPSPSPTGTCRRPPRRHAPRRGRWRLQRRKRA
jgi:membrane peptidoglycan carboxypeptidase